MRIGELARRSGLNTSRIRFYEAKGLLNVVSRKANGYRDYPADALIILGIITSAQRTGFSLDQIGKILPADLGNWRRDELVGTLRRKIADIAQMETRLSQSKKELRALIRKIESKPDSMTCEDNTRRLLKEFVPDRSPMVVPELRRAPATAPVRKTRDSNPGRSSPRAATRTGQPRRA